MIRTVRFEEVKYKGIAKGICPVCKKSVVRAKTFTNTINPFNRNKDGEIKSWKEVSIDVKNRAEKWEKSDIDFTHGKCFVSN